MASARLGRLVERVLHLHDTPRRTAAALALGVFLSFSPFLGFQIVLAVTLAFGLQLNRAAVFIGLNANLPWFVAPWYAATTLAAAAWLGTGVPPDLARQFGDLFDLGLLNGAFWRRLVTMLRPLAWPFLVGPTAGAAAIGAATYLAARAVLLKRHPGALATAAGDDA